MSTFLLLRAGLACSRQRAERGEPYQAAHAEVTALIGELGYPAPHRAQFLEAFAFGYLSHLTRERRPEIAA